DTVMASLLSLSAMSPHARRLFPRTVDCQPSAPSRCCGSIGTELVPEPSSRPAHVMPVLAARWDLPDWAAAGPREIEKRRSRVSNSEHRFRRSATLFDARTMRAQQHWPP